MNVLELFKNIETFVFDVDGVLTDGSFLVLESGEMARRMIVKDGYALQLAIKKGYKIFIISGSSKSAVDLRLRNLGIQDIYFKIKDKCAFLLELQRENGFDMNKTLFMGDDIPDLPVLNIVGLSTCPQDAVEEVKNISKYVSPMAGGYGCVRDVIEKVLKLRGDWALDKEIAST